MPAGSFDVNLKELHSATARVTAQREIIDTGIWAIRATFKKIEDRWKSPSGTAFAGAATEFKRLSDELMSLFDEAIVRMRAAHDNYANTELINTINNNSLYPKLASMSGGTGATGSFEPAVLGVPGGPVDPRAGAPLAPAVLGVPAAPAAPGTAPLEPAARFVPGAPLEPGTAPLKPAARFVPGAP